MPPRHSCGTRTMAGASGGAFIALSRREVRTEHVKRLQRRSPGSVGSMTGSTRALPSNSGTRSANNFSPSQRSPRGLLGEPPVSYRSCRGCRSGPSPFSHCIAFASSHRSTCFTKSSGGRRRHLASATIRVTISKPRPRAITAQPLEACWASARRSLGATDSLPRAACEWHARRCSWRRPASALNTTSANPGTVYQALAAQPAAPCLLGSTPPRHSASGTVTPVPRHRRRRAAAQRQRHRRRRVRAVYG